MPGGHRGRGVVVVQLHIDVHGTAFLLLPQHPLEFVRIAGRDEPQQVFQSVFFGGAAVVGGECGGDAVKTCLGDGFDFAVERPLFLRRGVADQRPEIGDVGDLGHKGTQRCVPFAINECRSMPRLNIGADRTKRGEAKARRRREYKVFVFHRAFA